MATMQEIKGRTEKDIIEILARNGIAPEGNFWWEYEQAKKLCFEGKFINTDIYNKQIRWIIDYLGS